MLKPGGRLIFMDSLQLGDVEGYDGMLQSFPVNFHEPYYGSYIKENLADIFSEAGLTHARAARYSCQNWWFATNPEAEPL